jgi:hypothetical protein
MTGSARRDAWWPTAAAGATSQVAPLATPRAAVWRSPPLHIARTTMAFAHFIEGNASRSPHRARRSGC